jgi:hypothetical protein
MKGVSKFKEALLSKSLTRLTEASSELAEQLAYQLKPPYTQILQFKAEEENGRFAVRFSAELHLHYSSLRSDQEGLVFTINFGGEAFADSPNPPIHELFYAGVVESLKVCGYGPRWKGKPLQTSEEFVTNLEIRARTLNRIDLDDFYRILEAAT